MTDQLVWVTGASGFIGSRIADHLVASGYKVIGFDRARLATCPCFQFVVGEITQQSFEIALKSYGSPTSIYHLSGGSTVGHSFVEPYVDFESNVQTTAALFDAVRSNSLESHILLASSAAVYGSDYDQPISKDAEMRPLSPYGFHKRMAEQLAYYHVEFFGVACTVLRLFSVYGSGLKKQLLYDLCSRLNSGERNVVLGGTGSELRDWCHVDDVVAAFVNFKYSDNTGYHVYNVGTGVGTRISEIASHVARCWGNDSLISFSNVCRKGDPHSLVSCSKSLPDGFIPRKDLQEGIADFVLHFKEGLHGD